MSSCLSSITNALNVELSASFQGQGLQEKSTGYHEPGHIFAQFLI